MSESSGGSGGTDVEEGEEDDGTGDRRCLEDGTFARSHEVPSGPECLEDGGDQHGDNGWCVLGGRVLVLVDFDDLNNVNDHLEDRCQYFFVRASLNRERTTYARVNNDEEQAHKGALLSGETSKVDQLVFFNHVGSD